MFGLPKQLWVVLTGLFIFQIILMNFSGCLACISRVPTVIPKNIPCSTPACERAASSIIRRIDEKFDPCSNFLEFACGGFLNRSRLREGIVDFTELERLQNEVNDVLYLAMEYGITDNDPPAFKLVKSFYDVCMNKDWIEKNGVAEFKKILDKLGGWPLLARDSWNVAAFDWRTTMLKFREEGFRFSQFLHVYVPVDMTNSDKNLVYLNASEAVFPQLKKGLKNDVVKAYSKSMVKLAVLFGADRSRAAEELGQSLNFQINLAKLPGTLTKERDNKPRSMSVAELMKVYPLPGSGPNWLDYLNGLLEPHASLQDDDVVIVVSPSYLKALIELLDKTPKRVQANYAFWTIAEWAAERLNKRMSHTVMKFPAVTDVGTYSGLRWEHCVMQAKEYLPLAVGTLYARKHVSEGTKELATELNNDVIKSYKKLLQKVKWMSYTTKKSVLGKLKSLKSIIAYPDELLDDEKINAYYKGLQIHPESYLRTSLSINLFYLKHEIDKLNKPMIDRFDWLLYSHATTLDVSYSPKDNAIIFPAAILQGKFFNKDNPMYMNYATLGSTVGYKIAQSFFGKGRFFDENGNIFDWWDYRSKEGYTKVYNCFREQYEKYTLKTFNLTLSSEMSQGEHLAKHCGVKEAYYAYEDWEKRHGPEPRLLDLEKYSPRQLFWISYASMGCANIREEVLSTLIEIGQIVPEEFRVNEPLSNMAEFARDFDCPKDSAMNLKNRCQVW